MINGHVCTIRASVPSTSTGPDIILIGEADNIIILQKPSELRLENQMTSAIDEMRTSNLWINMKIIHLLI